MTILAIVLGLGVPAMGTYLQNSKLASATSSYYAGVQTARTEAIRRNVQTRVRSHQSAAVAGNVDNAAALPVANGRSWVVRSPVAAAGGF